MGVIPAKAGIQGPHILSPALDPRFRGGDGGGIGRTQPDRSVVEYRAAARQAGIGASQQIDADALLESAVRPQPLDDDDAKLHPVEAADMDDDAALRIADADAFALRDAE